MDRCDAEWIAGVRSQGMYRGFEAFAIGSTTLISLLLCNTIVVSSVFFLISLHNHESLH